VWNRDQVRGLMYSMYRGHPVGGLLLWETSTENMAVRGGLTGSGTHLLLLDGLQRMTTLYGMIRGKAPAEDAALKSQNIRSSRCTSATSAKVGSKASFVFAMVNPSEEQAGAGTAHLLLHRWWLVPDGATPKWDTSLCS
jgi:hypothetical protein